MQYKKAEMNLKRTGETVKDWDAEKIAGNDYERLAQKARAKADYEDAKANLEAAKALLRSMNLDVGQIRKELAAAIEDEYIAKPSQIDTNTLELLKSGILKPGEYSSLMNAAKEKNNHTMVRMIARYAGEAAELEEKSPSTLDATKQHETLATLRAVSELGKNVDGSEYLKTFDSLAGAFEKCTENTAMIDSWDSITADTVENF